MFSLNSQSNKNSTAGSGWNSATGFGNSTTTASIPNNTGGSLFGNSASQSTGGLFGTQSNTSTASGGLGDKTANNPGATSMFGGSTGNAPVSGGLFGNSSNTTSNNTASTTNGLFGNSNTSNTTSGGLFGNTTNSATNNTTSTSNGLFGNSNTSNTTSGGLFGNSASTNTSNGGGLFGNKPSAPATGSSGGLFGNNSSNNNSMTTGLSTSTNSGNQAGGLFGNTNTNNGGLFGSKPATSTGGLFGSTANSQAGIGSFNNSQPGNNVATNNNLNLNNSNPYNYDAALSKNTTITSMPQSITENILDKEPTNKKRMFSETKSEPVYAPKPTLLSKLSQTLNFFSGSYWKKQASSHKTGVDGLFSSKSSSILKPKPKSQTLSKTSHFKVFDSFGHGDLKRLVIKSKPLKFHLIDTEKVFNNKRRRVLMDSKPNPLLDVQECEYLSSDEESSNPESSHQKPNVNARFPYKAHNKSNSAAYKDDGKLQRIVDEENKQDDPNLNDGYWCSPSINQLSKYSLEALKEIDNFIIGRVGFGQISFNFPVDLSDLYSQAKADGTELKDQLFGKIIVFKQGRVEVYNNYKNKPAVGFGMNIPATITLENMFPKRGMTSSDYIRLLQRQKEMDFVTYDPITGSWTFKVQHFSVWGLIEEAEVDKEKRIEEEEEEKEKEEEDCDMKCAHQFENDEIRKEIIKEKSEQIISAFPGGWTSDNDTSSLKLKKKLVENEINNQIESHNALQVSNSIQTGGEITVDTESSRSASPASFVLPEEDTYEYKDKNESKFNYLKQLVSVLPRNLSMNQLIDEKAYEPEIADEAVFENIQVRPNLAVSNDWLIQLEMANDMNSSLNPSHGNEGKMALNIDNVDKILFGDKKLSDFPKKASSQEEKQVTDTISTLAPGTADQIKSIRSKTSVYSRKNMFPALPDSSQSLFSDLINDKLENEEVYVLKLCTSLFDYKGFDDISQADENVKKHLSKLNKRKVFSDWLIEYNQNHCDLTDNDDFGKLFQHVCVGNIRGAIEFATSTNNSHLAVLLTLLDANDPSVKDIANAQLQYWKEYNTERLIPKIVYSIYQILANEFDKLVVELPWNIALGLEFLYGDHNQTLNEVIKKIEQKYNPQNRIFSVLKFYEQTQTLGIQETIRNFIFNSLDTKIQWFINYILGDSKVTNYDELSIKFGNELKQNGYWKEAIFVYSDIRNDDMSKKCIQELIINNIECIKNEDVDEEQFLKECLLVPQNVIYEAIAQQQEKLGNYWQQCEALLVAQAWDQVHDCIVKQLGPYTIVSNNSMNRSKLLEIVNQIPHNGLILPQWNQNAGIFIQFIELLDLYDQNQQFANSSFKTSLKSLINNISSYKNEKSTLQSKAAFEIMSKKVGDWALTLGISKSEILSMPLDENGHHYFQARLALLS